MPFPTPNLTLTRKQSTEFGANGRTGRSAPSAAATVPRTGLAPAMVHSMVEPVVQGTRGSDRPVNCGNVPVGVALGWCG